jgi:opacity protein-like surface antigen
MIKILSTVAALTCMLAANTAFATGPNSNYVKLLGKYTKMSDMDITNQVQLDSDDGYGFGAAIGTHIDWFKIEAEIATQENDINNFEVRELGGRAFRTADSRIDTLMLNAFVDIPVADDISLWGGGGIGGAAVTVSARDFDADETVFAYKLAAGASYNFTDEFGAELGYEYLATEDVEYNLLEVKDISSSNLTLALKYMF